MFFDFLLELGLAIGRFFINPLLYIVILLGIYLGYRRVKRERKYFHIRILWGWSELIGLLKEGLLWALLISIISILVGLTVPIEFLYFIMVASILAVITYMFHFLSPIIIFTICFFILMWMDKQQVSFTILNVEFGGIDPWHGAAVTVTILAGLLLIAEGLLIRKHGAVNASPIVERTKRGLNAISYLTKKAWVLPVLFVVPGEAIDAYFPWWPQFSLGSEQFSLVLFPIVIGFSQMTRQTLPLYVYPKLGRAVLILGELVIIGGLIAYFEPLAGLITLIIGAISRLAISIIYVVRERKDTYAVSPKSSGVMVAAILPNSPAEKMELKVGEIIRKVNGVEVRTERELYEALQINAAHCRLEVLNHNNEVRLTQHVVHREDHFRIGLIIAE